MNGNQVTFMGAPVPVNIGPMSHMDYFQQYRNESISRMQVPTYEWGSLHISYSPRPDASVYKKTREYATLPQSQFSMLDFARQQEVDDFYLVQNYLFKDFEGIRFDTKENYKKSHKNGVESLYLKRISLGNTNWLCFACQLHRDQYRDCTGTLHPLDYFKSDDYLYQCPTDPTSQYMKCPEYYTKYKHPLTLPITIEKSLHTPSLPTRALTGVYTRSSDIAYKR